MEVSSIGYYAWRFRPESARALQQTELVEQIRIVYETSRKTYGSPRVYHELKALGVSSGLHQIAGLMRLHGIRARQKRRFVLTTKSDAVLPVQSNVLDRQFAVSVPDQCWAADMTYIWTMEGWLYLAVVLDLFHRGVVGWSMEDTMEQRLVLQALDMAFQKRRPPEGLLHHSDRGSQYAGHAYQEQLDRHGVKASMSRKGNCWDNAVVESFFATLKTELTQGHLYKTRQEARAEIFEYIEVWYNRQRRHSTLGYISPSEFERNARLKIAA
jgi:putative transposase